MEKLLSLLLIISVQEALSVNPAISQHCKGEHQYINQDGECRLCEMCPFGSQPTGYCGHGERIANYKCETCPNETFSLHNGYNVCVHCRPCKMWNSFVYQECTSKSDRICGECFEGYFRTRNGHGMLDGECHSCDAAVKYEPGCHVDVDEFPWKIVAISSFAGCVVLIVVLVSCCCWQCQRRKKSVKHEKIPPAGTRFLEDPSDSSQVSESLLSQSLATFHSHNSRSDFEQQTEARNSLGNSSQTSIGDARPTTSLPVSGEPAIKAAATGNASSLQPTSGNILYAGYSDMPTAEYRESLPHINNAQSLSDMPTRPYEENDTNLQNLSNESADSSRPFRLHSMYRRPLEQSSSSENLLDNVDRDSKDVGGCQTPYEFQADSFDTRSYSDSTKPHIAVYNG